MSEGSHFIRPEVALGTQLFNGWKLSTPLRHIHPDSGSSHGVCVNNEGRQAFLKVNWLQKANSGPENFKTNASRHAFEIQLLSYCKDMNLPGIIRLFDHGQITEKNNFHFDAMVLERADSAADLEFTSLPGDLLWWFSAHLMQIAYSVSVLHKHQIVHRDLTPQNIVLANNRTTSLLTDFGTAFWLNHPSPTDLLRVTTPYHLSPPERFVHHQWSSRWEKLTAIELWQFGNLLFQALVGTSLLKPLLGSRFGDFERLEEESFRPTPILKNQVESGFKEACSMLANTIIRKVPTDLQPQARILADIFKTACHPDLNKRGHPKLVGTGPDHRYRLEPYVEDLIGLVKVLKMLQPKNP
jgi:serine/threonine protein kinase